MLFIMLLPAAAGDAIFVFMALLLSYAKMEFFPTAFSTTVSFESPRLAFELLAPPFC
jgi:hypothetical protein